jgi:hypothetical protein
LGIFFIIRLLYQDKIREHIGSKVISISDSYRLYPFHVYVDGVQCVTIFDANSHKDGTSQTFSCTAGVVVGKVVRVNRQQRKTWYAHGHDGLTFCEFQIYSKHTRHVLQIETNMKLNEYFYAAQISIPKTAYGAGGIHPIFF